MIKFRTAVPVAALGLALAVSGCSSSSSTSESAAPSAAASSAAEGSTYTNDQYGFSFNYAPPFEEADSLDWQATSGGSSADSVAVVDPTGTKVDDKYQDAFIVSVYELNAEIGEAEMPAVKDELEQSVLPGLKESSPDIQLTELTETTVGGLPGYQTSATFTTGDTPMKSNMYFVFNGKIEYQLLEQAAADKWDGLQPTFDAMRNSFTVTTPEASPSS